ncbi:uncharacterized protein PV09_03030 [Verruconis gallopava]|uniref:Vacuolar protein-sorting-associated protein 36 n=1 Tax=Verruconis gallopava TaxID=253628 RepID=A0A0D2B3H1_9PEZI|nr:uncharacterized protein PV09_03030 [Verruconis gallopava]KIW05824.1 hypothetical protein PV09_03030 [Verruconis gallopava]
MLLRRIDLTTAFQPLPLQDETFLDVQDSVGLYDGKYKIPQYQNGRAYLTSHRICYVDNNEPRKYSVSVDLKDVDTVEYYGGFFKSSPKVTLYSKASKTTTLPSNNSPRTPAASPARQGSPALSLVPAPALNSNATWICPIDGFSNPIPINFDPATANVHTNIPPCLACGVKPSVAHVVKAALTQMSHRQAATTSPMLEPSSSKLNKVACPRCTFENDAALLVCEICSANLPAAANKRLDLETPLRSESPAPTLQNLNIGEDMPSIKLSFRSNNGKEEEFYKKLKHALVQRKWLLMSAPPIPHPQQRPSSPHNTLTRRPSDNLVGLAGLERRGQQLRQTNEMILGNAFEDLEALMTSAKEVIALAERFSTQARNTHGVSSEANAILSHSASALGIATTKDTLGSDNLYISELSRNIAEFLTDDAKGVLKREGGIMSLVDLWAVFNRARGGVELVSPADFVKAAEMWDKLSLPVRLRRFKSGLLVVQGRDRTDEKTIQSILSWMQMFHKGPSEAGANWDWRLFGKGVTVQEVATWFSWSVGVAQEELEMCEEKGYLCREQGVDGIKFWENWIVNLETSEK